MTISFDELREIVGFLADVAGLVMFVRALNRHEV